MLRGVIFGLAAALTLTTAAWAKPKPDFGPPAKWVQVAEIPPAPPGDDTPAVQTILDDNQSRLDPKGDAAYNRRVWKIAKPQGLAGFKSVSLTWSPDSEDVTFHTLRIIRGDKVIDLLGGGRKMLVLRRERDLERSMLDGRVTASQQIEGLQVGDILDFSWTQTRHDPIAQGHSYDNEGLTFSGVASRYRVVVSWPDGEHMHWKQWPGTDAAAVAHRDGRTWLTLDERNLKPPIAPVGAPPRFRRLGAIETSGFESWREVSALMWPHFEKAMALKPDSPIRAEAAAISARYPDEKGRAFAALQLVEDKTRYFFIGIGDGGYVPASADLTWDRKFGDCKGKTVLLMALLRELGIKAEPALVSLGGGDGLDERPASMAAFNHVIVRATIRGKVYWLDGTRAGDKNGLEVLRPPLHKWALPLRREGADLERIDVPPLTEPSLELVSRFDASKGLDTPAAMATTMVVRGDAANVMRQLLTAGSRADLERRMLQSMSSSPWMQIEKLDWKDDPAHDAFDIEITGHADLDWRKNPDLGVREYRVAVGQTQVNGFPHRDAGPNRDAPFAVAYPVFSRATVEIVLPNGGKGFVVRGPNQSERIAGSELTRVSEIKNGVARFVTEARSLAPEISATEAASAAKLVRQAFGDDSLVRAPS